MAWTLASSSLGFEVARVRTVMLVTSLASTGPAGRDFGSSSRLLPGRGTYDEPASFILRLFRAILTSATIVLAGVKSFRIGARTFYGAVTELLLPDHKTIGIDKTGE